MRSIGVTALCATVLGALLCLAAPAEAEILVSISKSQQRLAVVVDGAEAYRWPVSTGRRGHATPAGNFRPIRLERHWYSRQYDLTPMPWAVFFHRGYAVHGTMEAHNLGHVASHGCVRLRPDNAAILYSLLRRHGIGNAKIVVMNGALPVVPGATSLSELEAPKAGDGAAEHFAAATGEGREEFAAKTHRGAETAGGHEKGIGGKPGTMRLASANANRVSVGSDEARILREREAWLRGLDRKYGIAR